MRGPAETRDQRSEQECHAEHLEHFLHDALEVTDGIEGRRVEAPLHVIPDIEAGRDPLMEIPRMFRIQAFEEVEDDSHSPARERDERPVPPA